MFYPGNVKGEGKPTLVYISKPIYWNYLDYQNEVKLSYPAKTMDLYITKVYNMFFETEDDCIILNNDYNTVNNIDLAMRPIHYTILK